MCLFRRYICATHPETADFAAAVEHSWYDVMPNIEQTLQKSAFRNLNLSEYRIQFYTEHPS